jgi:hypothetical protein
VDPENGRQGGRIGLWRRALSTLPLFKRGNVTTFHKKSLKTVLRSHVWLHKKALASSGTLDRSSVGWRTWEQVAFVGEDGSDFGGVRREWYSLVTQVLTLPAVFRWVDPKP